MAGGILQLVSNANSVENMWLNNEPQITMFKTVYRRHTEFATELIQVPIPHVDFGQSTSFIIPKAGDLAHRIYLAFELPELRAAYTKSKTHDVELAVNKAASSGSVIAAELGANIENGNDLELDNLMYRISEAMKTYQDCQIGTEISQELITAADLKPNVTTKSRRFDPLNIVVGRRLTNEVISEDYSAKTYSAVNYKLSLYDKLIESNPKYKTVYDIVRLMYALTDEDSGKKAVIKARDLPNYLFNNLINRELLTRTMTMPFDHVISTYNTFAAVAKLLATTVPIIAFKMFQVRSNQPFSIFDSQPQSHELVSLPRYRTQLDPNFQYRFEYGVYHDICSDSVIFSPASGPYYKLFTINASSMFKTIRSGLDALFDAYDDLFSSTDRLFYNRSAVLSGTHGLAVPSSGPNVLNINTWYGYFFKYLDMVDELALGKEIASIPNIELSQPAIDFMLNLIILLKINIDYYITEASYYLNDLYSNAPSDDPSQTMKTYTPPSRIKTNDQLLTVSLIFHRSHVPSITEIFEYVNLFIDTIDIDTIASNLDVQMFAIEPSDELYVRNIVKHTYKLIHQHYTQVYNGLNLEPTISNDIFSVTKLDKSTINTIKLFVQDYLFNTIAKSRSQAEFYFCAELINERSQNQFYYNMLGNGGLIESVAGIDVANLVKSFEFKPIYYTTNNINRYTGQSYSNTEYKSRHTNLPISAPIPPPIPKPNTNYGVKSSHFDHNQQTENLIPINWNKLLPAHMSLPIEGYSTNSLTNSLTNYSRLQHNHIQPQYINTDIDSKTELIIIIDKILETDQSIRPDLLAYVINSDLVQPEISYQLILYQNSIVDVCRILTGIQESITAEELIKFNGYASMFETDVTTSSIDKIFIARNNWLQQYAFYLTNKTSLTAISQGTMPPLSDNSLSTYIENKMRSLQVTISDTITTKINKVFSFVSEIVYQCQKLGCVNDILTVFEPYYKLLVAKLDIYTLFTDIINKITTNKSSLTDEDINQIVVKARGHGITINIHMIKSWIIRIFKLYGHEESKLVSVMYEGIDDYILNEYTEPTEHMRLKQLIISKVFGPFSEILVAYAKRIPSKYLVIVYYALSDNLTNAINPLRLTPNLLGNDDHCQCTTNSYLIQMLDLIVDQAVDVANTSKIFELADDLLEPVSSRPIGLVQALSLASTESELRIILSKQTKQDMSSSVGCNFTWKQMIIDKLSEVLRRRLVYLREQMSLLSDLERTISVILTRNSRAEAAWIRKLAHYLVSEVTFMRGENGINETHTSDCFEFNNELFGSAGTTKAYNKMIGHIDSMYTFNTEDKPSTTIVLPLMFYFNQNIALSLPLNASTKTPHRIKFKLRSLTDVAYKAEFSEFVVNGKVSMPKILNAYAMIEYVYLGLQERRIFSESYLEYLITVKRADEASQITNLKPVYKVQNGSSHSFIETQSPNNYDVIPNTNYQLTEYVDRTGIRKTMFFDSTDLTNKESLISRKRTKIRNHFNDPSKYFVFGVKMLAHTNTNELSSRSNLHYWPGEKQWDNFGLHSYFDLSAVELYRKLALSKLTDRLYDLDDKTFGFVAVVNALLTRSTPSDLGPVLKYIINCYNYYTEPIFFRTGISRLWNNLAKIKADYIVVDTKILSMMLQDVSEFLKSRPISSSSLSVPVSRSEFVISILKVYRKEIDAVIVKEIDVSNTAHLVFDSYVNSVNCMLVNCIAEYVELATDTFDLMSVVDTFDSLHEQTPVITQAIDAIRSKITAGHTVKPEGITFMEDVLIQISSPESKTDITEYYANTLSYDTIKELTSSLIHTRNNIINKTYAADANYSKLAKPNPLINPVTSGNIEFNGVPIKPGNLSSLSWSELEAWKYTNSTPSTGINLHSWSLYPKSIQPSGSASLSNIKTFDLALDLHPLIDDNNPATISKMTETINIVRYIGGLSGTVW